MGVCIPFSRYPYIYLPSPGFQTSLMCTSGGGRYRDPQGIFPRVVKSSTVFLVCELRVYQLLLGGAGLRAPFPGPKYHLFVPARGSKSSPLGDNPACRIVLFRIFILRVEGLPTGASRATSRFRIALFCTDRGGVEPEILHRLGNPSTPKVSLAAPRPQILHNRSGGTRTG